MKNQHRSLSKTLKLLRLIAARAAWLDANRYLEDISKPDTAEQIIELSEEYVFRAVLLWLVGAPSVTYAAELARAGEYPFVHSEPSESFTNALREISELLSSQFEPGFSLVGTLYEHMQKFPLVIENSAPSFPDSKEESKVSRRAVGQFYTPPHIVDYCFERAFDADSGSVGVCWQSKSLLDPACGTGNFLLGALRYAGKFAPAPSLLEYANKYLFGLDIDGRAVSLCRASIVAAVIGGSLKPEQAEQFLAADISKLLASLRENIKQTDSLLASPPNHSESHSWFLQADQFDLVLTNPPYISFGARNQSKLGVASAKYLRSLFPDSAEYKIRLYSVFQEIALRFVKPGGVVTLLIPDGFMTGSYYRRLREALLSGARIRSISEFPADTISGAVVGRWCVATYQKGEDATDYLISLRSYISQPEQRYTLPKSAFVAPDASRFRMVFHDIDQQLCHMADRLKPLSSLLRGHTGIRALNGQATICSTTRRSNEWLKGLRSGSAVSPYLVNWDGTWLHVRKDLLYGGGFDPQIIENGKILVRQTGDCLVGAVDRSGLYHLNNVHSLSPTDPNVDLDLINALLNSTLWLHLYRLKTREIGRALAQIDIETLESMPLPARNSRIESEISKLAQQISRLDQNEKGRADAKATIDRLVYDIYGLNEGFVEHVEIACGRLPAGASKHKAQIYTALEMPVATSVATSKQIANMPE